MAFLPENTNDGHVVPWQYLPAKAGNYVVGQALVFSEGQLVPVSDGVGQDTANGPHYIAMQEGTITGEGDTLPVLASDESILWETTLATNGALAVGAAYCIHADGLQVNATATNGCFLVLEKDGDSAGSRVRGRLA